jgi:SAM-dependent methyltransferase
MDMADIFDPQTFDLIVATASLHHHSHLEDVFRILHGLLKPRGILVIGDWHNSVWLYPGRVLRLLKKFEWRQKTTDLKRFERLYNVAVPPEDSSVLQKANKQIGDFWRAYARVRTPNAPRYEILEGHRPPKEYTRLLKMSGFASVTCHRLLPDSALLCVHTARK